MHFFNAFFCIRSQKVLAEHGVSCPIWLCILLLLFSPCLPSIQAREAHNLEPKQISAIMHQIFSEHFEQKEMSASLMQESIRLYIDQFDPQHLYLLRSEVVPYWNLDTEALQQLVQEYNDQNYSIFKKLDTLFASAIQRAKTIRSVREHAKQSPLQSSALSLKEQIKEEPVLTSTDHAAQRLAQFAASPDILELRWKKQWQNYMRTQAKRFGEDYITSKQDLLLRQLEESLGERENLYLTQNVPLSQKDQDHYFSLRILKAVASSLDPHTAFFDDNEAFKMKTHLDKGFEGLGIRLRENEGHFVIHSLIPEGAAEKSHLVHPGDVLVRVQTEAAGDQPLAGKSLEQVLNLLRSDSQHPVTLVLKQGAHSPKPGQWVEVRLTPQKITLNDDRVKSGFIPFDGGILGWITLNSFYEGGGGVSSSEDVQASITALRKQGDLKGLILDLRNNGGGYLNQAVKLAGLFIKSGVVVVAKYNDGLSHIYRDTHKEQDYDGPLLILTSRITASAAEIVAQALQDYGVALVAGDGRTYGKGTIQAQNVTDKASTSYFKVTVGKYYTVSGKTAQIDGVISDLIVPGPYSMMQIGEAYLDHPLPNDNIAANFDDTLDDLDLFTRQWYLRSYLPHLQRPTTYWRQMLPSLRLANQKRISSSPSYQRFIRRLSLQGMLGNKQQQNALPPEPPLSKAELAQETIHGVPPIVPGDIQLSGAILVVEDMANAAKATSTANTASTLPQGD